MTEEKYDKDFAQSLFGHLGEELRHPTVLQQEYELTDRGRIVYLADSDITEDEKDVVWYMREKQEPQSAESIGYALKMPKILRVLEKLHNKGLARESI